MLYTEVQVSTPITQPRAEGPRPCKLIRTIEMDECAGARRVSELVAALEISPQGAATWN